MHRFFLHEGRSLYLNGAGFRAAGDVAHQLGTVLRLRPGERIEVLDNAGAVYLVEIRAVQRQEVTGIVLDRRPATGEPAIRITLYQGLLKGERFEWALQKCTEVGVTGFVPVLCARSIARPEEARRKHARWERILLEAAEQAQRGCIPDLSPVLSFADSCKHAAAENALALLAWEGEQRRTLRSALEDYGDAARVTEAERAIGLFIGPEGGFSGEEVQLAEEYGIQAVTLGPRILRAETAGLVAATIILHSYNQMQ